MEKQKSGSYIGMVRYGDDFVICGQRKEVAEQLRSELSKGLAKFRMELSGKKTRIVEFGRYARENSRKKGCKLFKEEKDVCSTRELH